MKMYNLISDTVTKPCKAMLEAMYKAEVGDDVFSEDPTVNHLEEKMAQLFQKEKALFCPSGTMTNQMAIKINTQALDEMICNSLSHVVKYESAGYAWFSSIATQLIDRKDGKITPEQIQASLKPRYDWLPRSRLVVMENTCNAGGGTVYTLAEAKEIAKFCRQNQLKLHLDGARIFNALQHSGESPQDWGPLFDTLSVCLSKGLGAPVGSLLLGSAEDIALARRYRKILGGGMRQAGYLAAAGIYALDHNLTRLKEDHQHAAWLAQALQSAPSVDRVSPPLTNILLYHLKETLDGAAYLEKLREKGVKASLFGPKMVRMVTHKDLSTQDIEQVCSIVSQI
jgi:threonine aldolase